MNGFRNAWPIALSILVIVFLVRFVFGNHTFTQCGAEAIVVASVALATYLIGYFRSERTWGVKDWPRQLYSLFAALAMMLVCAWFSKGVVFDSIAWMFLYAIANAFVYRTAYMHRLWGPHRPY